MSGALYIQKNPRAIVRRGYKGSGSESQPRGAQSPCWRTVSGLEGYSREVTKQDLQALTPVTDPHIVRLRITEIA